MFIYLLILLLIFFLFLFRDYFYSLLSFISLRLEGREPDFQVLNSLRDDLIHERKKKIASLEMILSTWEKGEGISTHLNYFKDLISQLKLILKDQRENLLMISSDPFLWVRLRSKVFRIERASGKIEKDKQEIQEIKKRLRIFSDEIEEILEKATQKFSFSLNEVIKESVKIVRTEKDRVLKEKGIKIEERYEDIGERFRLPYKSYRDWQKLISNLIRNGVEAVESKLPATSYKLQAGAVRVLVGGKDDDVAVVVEDNGTGMDEKTMESFYKRGFTQGKQSGLGLGITEETVEFVNKYGSWDIESKTNEGTRIEIKIEKEKARKQDLTIEDRSALVIKLKSRKVMYALTWVLVVAIGLGLYFQFNKYARFWEDWNIDHVEVKGKSLKVLNKKNEVLWTKEFASLIGYPPAGQPSPVIEDINRDGRKEIIIALSPTDTSSGKVICMDSKGKELWNFYCGRKSIYDVEPDAFFPNIILPKDIDGDGNIEVIINNRVTVGFSDYLVILDSKGREKSEYWHPGLINVVYSKDVNKDGKDELVCGGINNRMDWCPCFFILDAKNIRGQAMPYCGEKSVPKAIELVYILFPHFKKIADKKFSWEHYLDYIWLIHFFSAKDDEIAYRVSDGNPSICWFLDHNFAVKDIAYNIGGINEQCSQLKFPFVVTQEDMDNLWDIEVWKESVRIR